MMLLKCFHLKNKTSNRPEWSTKEWGRKPFITGELLHLNYKDIVAWRNLHSCVRTSINSCEGLLIS